MVTVVQLHPASAGAALEPIAEGLEGAERALLARALEFAEPLYAGQRLSTGEATVTDLAEPFEMSMPAISKHLKVLERAGLVARSREAQWRPCRIEAAPLKDVAEWERWYKTKHAAPELVREAVYGLPEVNRDSVPHARLVANPGCYPTAVQLGFLPLVEAGAVDVDHLIADAKSGVSGAGRKTELSLMYSEASDNFAAYHVMGHRHWPEIRQGLAQVARREVGLVFTPHLTPLIRGIHATLYARVTKDVDFQALFEERYAKEPFVDVMPEGSHPDTRSVRAANTCRIAVHRPPESAKRSDTLVVLSVIDNLVKGASGQAVQNMNLMFGLPETAGLDQVAVVP